MLSDRERSQFVLIERALVAADPLFVAKCSALGRKVHRAGVARAARGRRSVHAAGTVPMALLVCGLVLLVAGGVAATVPVVVAGIVLSGLALGLAATGPNQARPDPA